MYMYVLYNGLQLGYNLKYAYAKTKVYFPVAIFPVNMF